MSQNLTVPLVPYSLPSISLSLSLPLVLSRTLSWRSTCGILSGQSIRRIFEGKKKLVSHRGDKSQSDCTDGIAYVKKKEREKKKNRDGLFSLPSPFIGRILGFIYLSWRKYFSFSDLYLLSSSTLFQST